MSRQILSRLDATAWTYEAAGWALVWIRASPIRLEDRQRFRVPSAPLARTNLAPGPGRPRTCLGAWRSRWSAPLAKFSQPAILPFFSRNGERLLSTFQTALDDTPGYQYYGGDRYVASREAAGWEIASTSPRDPLAARRRGEVGRPRDLHARPRPLDAVRRHPEQFQLGTSRLFGGGLDGSFAPLSPLLAPIDDSGSPLIQRGRRRPARQQLNRPRYQRPASLPVLDRIPARGPAQRILLGWPAQQLRGQLRSRQPALELLARDKDGSRPRRALRHLPRR